MTDIFPMAYSIKTGYTAKLYYVGFPEKWKNELIKIAKENNPRFKIEFGLPTNALQKLIDSWLEGVVSISVLKDTTDDSKWFASTLPFDTKRKQTLFEIIKIWIKGTYVAAGKVPPQAKQHAKELCEEMSVDDFDNLYSESDVCLCGNDGTVSTEAYKAIPLIVAERLVGRNIEINGQSLHLLYSDKKELVTEAISEPKSGHRYSFAFEFSLQTTPPERHALLLCNASIRRWVPERINKDKLPFLKNAIKVHIKVSPDKYCKIPIEYNSTKKMVDWEQQDKECYNLYSYKELPETSALWEILEDNDSNILLPYKNGMSSFKESRIGTGVPVRDKAEVYFRFMDLLSDIVAKPEASQRVSIRQPLKYFKSPQEYNSCEDFRRWVASCTETNKICLEIYGNWQNSREAELLNDIMAKIAADFGDNSDNSCLEIEILKKDICDIANPIEKNERLARCDEIREHLSNTENVVGCICSISGADSYSDGKDPKEIIRNAFALSGRVVQFVVADDKESPQKVEHTVYDLYRQLGITFLSDTESMRAYRFGNVSCNAMYVCTQVHGISSKARFMPIFLSVDLETGRTRVDCGAFENRNISYRQACIEMAKLYHKSNLEDLCKHAQYSPAKQKLITMKNQHDTPEKAAVLFVHSEGNTRPMWGGISDKAISGYKCSEDYIPDEIDAGDSKNSYPIILKDTGVRILRVRNNDEIPDYYTKTNAKENYSSATGIFKYGKVFWSIAQKPNDPRYNNSLHDSRLDYPKRDYAEKDMTEIYPIQLQEGDDCSEWVKYAANLCSLSIQYSTSTVLPLPLHLAKNLTEYLFE